MKELNKVERFGYITQGLDLTVRARTIHNEIICMEVTPEGTSGTCKGEPVDLPVDIKKIDKIVDLVQLLRKSQIELKDGKITIIPFNGTEKTVNNGKIGDCLGVDGCGLESCTTKNAGGNELCGFFTCAVDVMPCPLEVHPVGGCVVHVPYCPIIF